MSIVMEQPNKRHATPTTPYWTMALHNEVEDKLEQLPDLAIVPPTPHGDFVHCLPPENPVYRKYSVFLAGSIEMGKAVQWQPRTALELCSYPITVNNPRRAEWNTNENSMSEQIEWELSALEQADVICFFIDETTKSPVTLFEFGKYADSGKVVICCGRRYFRYQNIKGVCEKYNIPHVETFAEFSGMIVTMLRDKGMELDHNGDLVGDNTHVAKPKAKSRFDMERQIAYLERQVADFQAKYEEEV